MDTEYDFSECVFCITVFVSNCFVLSNSTACGDVNHNSTNATCTICYDVHVDVCSGADACGGSCDLITSTIDNKTLPSFQFYIDCESLFLDLVMHNFESEEVKSIKFSLDTCDVNGRISSASSLLARSSIAAILVMVTSGVVSLF
jgi:hypothetical protein